MIVIQNEARWKNGDVVGDWKNGSRFVKVPTGWLRQDGEITTGVILSFSGRYYGNVFDPKNHMICEDLFPLSGDLEITNDTQ